MRLLPPLTTTHTELDEGLSILDEALQAASDAVRPVLAPAS
jgi:4-aminobutyrate aminotransferase-like enzyme